MKRLWGWMHACAQVLFLGLAGLLVTAVTVQIFWAGYGALVDTGNWAPHVAFAGMLRWLFLALFLVSLVGWLGRRAIWISFLACLLFLLQYVLIWVPQKIGMVVLRALHPVNAMVIVLTSLVVVRDAWRMVRAEWSTVRRAVPAGAVLFALLAGGWIVWAVAEVSHPEAQAAQGDQAANLAQATDADIPAGYQGAHNPNATGDAAAIAAGRKIAEANCIVCHGIDFKGRDLGTVRSANLTESGKTRSDEFLHWAISEGSARGMPAWKAKLSDEQRWQVITFLRAEAQ